MSATTLSDRIVWTGKNTGEVKAWVMTYVIDAGGAGRDQIAYFVQRKGSHMTKALWGNVVPDSAAEVSAAVWVEAEEAYVGLRDGDAIVHVAHGYFRVEPRVETEPEGDPC